MKIMRFMILPLLMVLAACSSGGSSGNATMSMTLSSSSVSAGGSLTATAQLTPTSTKQLPVNNIDVTYTSNRPDLIHFATTTATNFGNSSLTTKTNGSGATMVVLNVDNTVAIPSEGIDVVITATAVGLQSVQTLRVTAALPGSSGGAAEPKVTIELGASSIEDNGGQTTVTATVTDTAGTPLSGQTVSFTVSPSTAPVTITPINGGTSDSNGRAYATITGTTTATVQNVFVYASVGGVNVSAPLTINPTPQVETGPRNLTVSTDKTSVQSNQQLVVTAEVKDTSNNGVKDQAVTFSVEPAGLGTVTLINGGMSDSTGKAYAIVTAGAPTTTQNMWVYASTGTSPNELRTGSGPIEIVPTATAVSPSPAAVSMTADKTSLVPDQSDQNNSALITTVVTDKDGRAVSTETVTFSVVSGPVTVSSAAVSTDSYGKCYVVLSANPGTVNPTYALVKTTTSNGISQTIPFLVAPVGKPRLTFSIAKAVIEPADGEVLATVEVLDTNGNPVNGQNVSFSVLSGPASIVAGLTTVTTGSDGKATTKLVPTATAFASNILLSMQMTYQGATYSLVTTATVNPAIDLIVSLDSGSIDSSGQLIATATARTASGSPLSSQNVSFTVTGPATIVGQSTTTAADGTAKALIRHDGSSTIGNVIVQASVVYGGTTYRGYAVAVAKEVPIKLQLAVQSGFSPSYTQSGPLGSITDATTTTVDALTPAIPIKATLTYPDGTPIPNQTVTFRALDPGLFWNGAGGAANGTSVTATTTTSGDAYAVAIPGNFNTAGYIHIEASATVNGTTYRQIMPIAVQPTTIQRTFELDKTSVVVSPNDSPIVRGTFTLKDSTGNPLNGRNVTFSVLSGPATITSDPTVSTDGGGTAGVALSVTATVTRRETVYVKATTTVNGVTFTSIATFTVDPSIRITLATDSARVDTPNGRVLVTATVTDASGSPVVGQNVTFSILAGAANVATSPTVATSTSGVASAEIATTSADSTQNVLVRVSTTLNGVTYSQVTSFQIVKGVGTLVVTAPATTSASATAPASVRWFGDVSVRLLDANGNPRVNVPITLQVDTSSRVGYGIAIDSSGTFATSYTVNTDSQGIARFTIRSAVLSVSVKGELDSSIVVWRATTNDTPSVIGYATSSYSLTGQ